MTALPGRGLGLGPGLRRSLGITLLAGAAVLAALAAAVQGGEPAWHALARMQPPFVALALVLTAAAWGLRTLRTSVLVRALGVPIPMRRMFRYYMASVFVSHVTPTSTGGVPVFIYLLVREGLSPGRATAVALVDSGLVALWLLAAWPVAGWWAGRDSSVAGGPAAAVSLGALLASAAAVGAVCLLRPGRLMRAVLSVGRAPGEAAAAGWRARLRRRLRRLGRELLRLAWALRFFVRRRPGALAVAVLTTGVYWALYLSIPWAVVRGLGSPAPWLELAVRQLAFNVAQAFIPTPGGSVGAELMMAYLLRGMVPPSQLAVAVGVWRVCTYYASLAVGGVAFLRVMGEGANGGHRAAGPVGLSLIPTGKGPRRANPPRG